MNYFTRLLFVLAGLVFVASCTTQREIARPALFSVLNVQQEAGWSPTQEKLIAKHCPLGMPRLSRNYNFGPTELVAREGYVLMHSSVEKIPLWVCEYVTLDQISGNLVREKSPFKPEPLLKPGSRSELSDYERSGYDRGHQAPAGNQTRDTRLKNETFYLSNMAPQAPKMNREVWKSLEELSRSWIGKRRAVYMITGPMFYDPKEESRSTATGMIRHKIIGKNGVYVPTHFYKIVASRKANGDWEAIGFVIENSPQLRPYHFDKYVKPIEWIEQRTGIEFLPELEGPQKGRIKREASPLWN